VTHEFIELKYSAWSQGIVIGAKFSLVNE